MKTYMVWVKASTGSRYLDSQWARENAAEIRREELVNSMKASGSFNSHSVDIHIGEIADVALSGEGE